jgi:DNA-directed RNA polymerase subunit RPC12/RpoP
MPDPGATTHQQACFKCLRCGSEFKLSYTPGKVEERSCPNCESNSVRRLKPAPAKPAPPAGG